MHLIGRAPRSTSAADTSNTASAMSRSTTLQVVIGTTDAPDLPRGPALHGLGTIHLCDLGGPVDTPAVFPLHG